ncbi:YhcG family protein [Streptomyces sp. SCSIO ZS0520]|uniref:PDDEXK nuclease domain-containing protein n=1 Tax=Streptomyces sp. SCSIO ZS0520 TaxID=2892996 RepID=UPI0021D8132C|nr:PDDEXK nuclease domain-containing protein [Streptomyces sp. SCSIO ZS0520]
MTHDLTDETGNLPLPRQSSRARDSAPGAADPAVPSGFYELVDDLKTLVRGAHLRARLKVNTEMIRMYGEIGRTILERQEQGGWGSKVIDRVATELRTEFPDQRGFSRSNIKYMQQFARTWPESIGQQIVGQLPWGHIIALMQGCKTRPEQDFYARRASEEGWSRSQLELQIRTRLHERAGGAANNFAATLPAEDAAALSGIVKDPYRFEFTRAVVGGTQERELEDALCERVVQFLTELGAGFGFMGRQYPLRVGRSDYRIDLLFYHARLHRYVVVELKTTKAEPEHLGKLNFYLAVADDLLRDTARDDPTIGLLIAAEQDELVVEYALSRSGSPLAVATWTGVDAEAQQQLPSAEEVARVAQDALRAECGSTRQPEEERGERGGREREGGLGVRG